MKIYLLIANCIDVMKNYATKCEHGDDDDNDLEECDEDVGVGEAAEGEGEEGGEASVENRRTSVWADQQIIKY